MLDYKSKVGPEKYYKKAGVIQLYNLIEMGLEPCHKLCDFGCGSLRLGMYAIQYLDNYCYFGIEPNEELIDNGVNYNLGKKHNNKGFIIYKSDKCDIDHFDIEFDFIIAQSVFTHMSIDMIVETLESAHKSLADNGVFLVTIQEGRHNYPGDKWVKTNVSFTPKFFVELCETNGFIAIKVDLKHWNNLIWYKLVKK